MYKKLHNQKGISLISVIIGIGLTSVMALAIMRLTKSSSQAQQGMKTASEFTNIANQIQSKLHRRDYCRLSFGDGSYFLPDDPNNETVVPVPNLVRPVYTIDANGIKVFANQTVDEYVIPPNVDPDDPMTGLQMGDISLMGMNLVRMPNSNDLFLELLFMRRNSQAFGGRHLSRRIQLQAIFDADGSGTVRDCFSDFENLAESAIISACQDGLGGSYANDNDPNTPDCTNIPSICQMQLEIMKLKGVDDTQTLCGVTYQIADGGPGIITSGNSHPLPANYVPGTLLVSLLGAGGGGGCGGYPNKAGRRGRKGNIVTPAFNQLLVAPGDTISFSLGAGGNGGGKTSPFGCDDNKEAQQGGNTTLSFASYNFSVSGGAAGSKNGGNPRTGESVNFMGTTYAGGSGNSNSNGGNGQTGAGGGAGEGTLVDAKVGGKGGDGAVYIQYKVLQQL